MYEYQRIKVEGGLIVESTPGNGSVYSITVIRTLSPIGARAMGRISTPGYIVINNANRKAYLFHSDGPLAQDYIAEKLGPGSDEDLYYLTILIAGALNRTPITI